MKRTKRVALAALSAAGLAATLPATAMSTIDLPAGKTQGMVTYLTGGVGSDEAAAMKKAEARYPLCLEFVEHAKPRDEYLADVDVTIVKPGGAIALEAISDGPFLLAKLPDGKYTVHAEHDGKTQTRQVNVSSHDPRRVIFEWRG